MPLRFGSLAAVLGLMSLGLCAVQAQDADAAKPVLPAQPAPKAAAPAPAKQAPAATAPAQTLAPAAPAGDAAASLDLLKRQVIEKCQKTVQPDVLQFLGLLFEQCRDDAQNEVKLLETALAAKRATIQRLLSLKKQVDQAEGELADLKQKQQTLQQQWEQQQQAFAAGGPPPDVKLLDALDEAAAAIARKQSAQRQLLAAYYKLPRLDQVQAEAADLQMRLAKAQARVQNWAQDAQRARQALDAVKHMPKTAALSQLIVAGLGLEKPACNVSKPWAAEGRGLNLFLAQLDDGRLLGGAMRSEPVEVYDICGLIYGHKITMLLVNKHNPKDVLEFQGQVEVDAASQQPKSIRGELKSKGAPGPGQEWVFK